MRGGETGILPGTIVDCRFPVLKLIIFNRLCMQLEVVMCMQTISRKNFHISGGQNTICLNVASEIRKYADYARHGIFKYSVFGTRKMNHENVFLQK